jgi:hypothetical protein
LSSLSAKSPSSQFPFAALLLVQLEPKKTPPDEVHSPDPVNELAQATSVSLKASDGDARGSCLR